jgi:4-aminobutyrate aminotransferase-like enzyme
VLRVIEEENLIERSAAVGGHFQQSLQALQTRHPVIGGVRGAGLFIGLDFVDPATGEPDTAFATTVINKLKQNGILIGAAGKYGATLKIRPPLCFSNEDADLFSATLDSILNAR